MKLRLFIFSSQQFDLKNFKRGIYSRDRKFKRAPLMYAPQRKGTVMRLRIKTPRKPNSARRPVIKVLLSTRRRIVAHIPGQGHNLRKYSKVLIAGVGPKDLPGVHYTPIRGVYDFSGCNHKTKRRSVYGVKRPVELCTYIRKKLRKNM